MNRYKHSGAQARREDERGEPESSEYHPETQVAFEWAALTVFTGTTFACDAVAVLLQTGDEPARRSRSARPARVRGGQGTRRDAQSE